MALALVATPLPGTLSLAGRLAAGRRPRAAAGALALGLAGLLVGLAVAFFAPLPLAAAILLQLLLWALTGLLLAELERRLGVAPLRRRAAQTRPLLLITTWTLAVSVGGILWAFFFAPFFSRWGTAVYAKPSMAAQVLLVVVLFLAPAGALIGLARAAAGLPHRAAPPATFALAQILVFSTLAGVVAIHLWLRDEVLALQSVDTTPGIAAKGWAYPLLLVFFLAPLLMSSLYLAEARGIRDFLLRWAGAAAVLAFLVVNVETTLGALPVGWRIAAAREAAAEARWARAAGHWAWLVERVPPIPALREAVRTGARDALLAADPGLARRLLTAADDRMAEELAAGELREVARRLLATGLEPTRIHHATIQPVRRESYLDSSWSALLTALRAARPELSESEVKHRLKAVSASAAKIELPVGDPMTALRLASGLFSCQPLAVPLTRHRELLEAGRPVLFRPLGVAHWRLLYWSAPGADAAIWLDYRQWSKERGADERAASSLLLSGEELTASRSPRVLARVSRLGSLSRLQELLARDAGWTFVLAPEEEVAAWREQLPGSTERTSELELLAATRQAMEQRAWQRGLELARTLGAGRAREEVLALAWLEPESRTHLHGAERSAPEAAARRLLRAGELEGASNWFLSRLLALGRRDSRFACRWEATLLEAKTDLLPDHRPLLHRRLELAAAEGRLADASELAVAFARAAGWSPERVIAALEALAPIAGAGREARSRQALTRLLDKLPLLADFRDERGTVGRRSRLPAYWAARGALEQAPVAAAESWRRAVELEPLEPGFRQRLAEALERAGAREEARRARRGLEAVERVDRCPVAGPIAGPVTSAALLPGGTS